MALSRYNTVAISLHWLIALVLLGLIGLAKYMTGLEEADPDRYALTQWHKSFGILVLLLSVLRIAWRLGHRPPPLSASTAGWQKFASGATHLLLYFLMIAIPVSGWVMVSASPLNLSTVLFGVIPLPHLPVEAFVSKAAIADQAHQVHELLGNTLLAFALLHILAALWHQFFVKDNLIARMVVGREQVTAGDNRHGLVVGVLVAAAGALYLANTASFSTGVGSSTSTVREAGLEAPRISFVGFVAQQMGKPLSGEFTSATIKLKLDAKDVANSTLEATVQTGSAVTGDSQIDATLPTDDWFDSSEYPDAVFVSTSMVAQSDDTIEVTGDLSIRGNSRSIIFPMQLKENSAIGKFSIDRKEFAVGVGGQDEFIGPDVEIRFEVSRD